MRCASSAAIISLVKQKCGGRTLPYRRNYLRGRGAAHRAGEPYLRAGGADSRRGSDGEEDYRQWATRREIHDGSDRTRYRNGSGRRIVSGGDSFWRGLRDGRHARRHEGVFGEEATAVQREVREV